MLSDPIWNKHNGMDLAEAQQVRDLKPKVHASVVCVAEVLKLPRVEIFIVEERNVDGLLTHRLSPRQLIREEN